MYLNKNSFLKRDIIENFIILPEKRLNQIDDLLNITNSSADNTNNHVNIDDSLCDSYEKAYLLYCDLYSCAIFDEVAWV